MRLSSGDRNLALALKDFRDGVGGIYIWPMLGWLEIKQRYRRSVIGPFWITLSTGALVAGMGPLYGKLLNQDIASYFVFLAVSFVVWQFLANLTVESCQAFISAEGLIKQTKLPLSIHVLRVVWKNTIIFAHNLIVVLVVFVFFGFPGAQYLFLALFGVLVIAVNGIWVGTVLGLICARFRDIPQIVISIVQIALFLTPIMWKPEMLGRNRWVADLNPLYHFLEMVRAPLLGGFPSLSNWVAVGAMTLVGYMAMLLLFSRYRARIAYWV